MGWGGSWDSVSPYLAGGVQSGKARAALSPGAALTQSCRQLEGSLVLRFPGSSASLTQAFTELHAHLLWEVTGGRSHSDLSDITLVAVTVHAGLTA